MASKLAPATVRIDKWLWAARFFKTRGAATTAVAGGKVEVNGARAKPARLIAPGDTILIRLAPFEWDLVVTQLGERRGSVADAQRLYEETSKSREAREMRTLQLRDAPVLRTESGKPDKRDRRAIQKFRRKD